MVIHSKLFTDFSGNSYHGVLASGNESLHSSDSGQQGKEPESC